MMNQTLKFQDDAPVKKNMPSSSDYIHTMSDDLAQADGAQSSQRAALRAEFDSPLQNAAPPDSHVKLDQTSPFFDQAIPVSRGQASEPVETMPQSDRVENLKPLSENTRKKEQPSLERKKFSLNSTRSFLPLLIGIVGIIIVALATGLYFLLNDKKEDIAQPTTSSQQTQPGSETNTPTTINPVSETISTDKPNLFILDMAEISAEEIRSELVAASLKVNSLQPSKPVEFIVVDSNNNPVAFPIFATASQLAFSPAFLANTEESFSIYMFSDNGAVRLGLSFKTKDASLAKKEMSTQEKTLPMDISLLFLETKIPLETNTEFKSGSYNQTEVRYLNLDEQNSLSIDYALSDSVFILGTSKNTLRAIMDLLGN